MHVRVATWNIRSGLSFDRRSFWWWRRPRVRDVLADLGPDVVGAQEVFAFQRRWLLRRCHPDGCWGAVGSGRGRGGRGEAAPVLWRTDRLEVTGATTRWFGEQPERSGTRAADADAPRIATWVDLDADERDSSFRVVNTHFASHSDRARHAAAAQLVAELTAAPERPTIVVGDFNATLGDAELAPLLTHGLRSVLPDGAGPTATAFEREPGRRLDHVLVSPEWEVVSGQVWSAAGTASDHYPVVADLRLP